MSRPVHPTYSESGELLTFHENADDEPLSWGGGADIASSDDIATGAGVAALSARVDAAEAAIDALEAADVAMDTRMDAAEVDIAALEGVDAALDTRLDTAESDIDALQAAAAVADLVGYVAVADDYTLVLTDRSKWLNLSNAADKTLTIPPNGTVAFPVGTSIMMSNDAAGLFTVAAGVGVTLRAQGGKVKLAGQFAVAALQKLAANEWVVFGNLTT